MPILIAAITLSLAQIVIGCACIFAGGLLIGLECSGVFGRSEFEAPDKPEGVRTIKVRCPHCANAHRVRTDA